MKKIVPILYVILFALTINAQGIHMTRMSPDLVNLNDSASVYKALYENTPIEPAFMLVPKFAIVGAENKFVFSTGANMKFTASYDLGNPVCNPGVSVRLILPRLD